jgi:cytochrome c5
MMAHLTHRSFNHTTLLALTVFVLLAGCAAPAQPAAGTSSPAANNPTAPASPAAETSGVKAAEAASSDVSFSQDLLPIFKASCVKCHGGEKTSRGLDLKTYDSVLAGSNRGAVVIPGNAADSKLAQLVLNGKMPKRGSKLSPEQVQMIVDWINAGAKNN